MIKRDLLGLNEGEQARNFRNPEEFNNFIKVYIYGLIS